MTASSGAEGREPVLVVLAAGASRRLGRPKALVELAGPGDTPLTRLLAAGAGFRERLVVSGAHAARIEAALAALAQEAAAGLEHLVHDDWELGRTGTVQRARAARPGRDLCLAPVDVPLVPARVFAELGAAWEAAGRPARGWLAPWVRVSGAGSGDGEGPGKEFGHPLIVGRALLAELSGWAADRPLKELRGRAAPLLALEVEAREILDDLDAPEDLEGLRRRLGGTGLQRGRSPRR